MRLLDSTAPDFQDSLDALGVPMDDQDGAVVDSVAEIIRTVRAKGDRALLAYNEKFDGWHAESVDDLEVTKAQMDEALDSIPQEQRVALTGAAQRIRDFHEHQLGRDWRIQDAYGNQLGQRVTALDSAGVYVPGGKASYPSSVLMNAIPARVAGVRNVVMVSPTPNGELNPLVLAAASLADVDRFYRVGGAQAVAAIAYGCAGLPQVAKIVGPGNRFVAEAKRQVFGQVAIDMIAGPSEILIIADGSADPDWMAMDLFSQAEHDESAQALMLCPDADYIQAVSDSVDRLLPDMPRAQIIAASLQRRGALIKTRDLNEAAKISNALAPEHLELAVVDPEKLLTEIHDAGAIFMGIHSCEALGDYCAGPNHVLPTAGTARFSSPLGVYDFQKRSSIIQCTAEGAKPLADIADVLARGESLTAHAQSAQLRAAK